MKKCLSIMLVMILLFSTMQVVVQAKEVDVESTGADDEYAPVGSKSVPDSVYKAQLQSFTCTLAAATNMIRARYYLSNNSSYTKFTENDVGEVGWINGTGLAGSFTFRYDGNTVSVTNNGLNGISVSSLKSLLDKHPEGIELYCSGVPHAVLVTDYSGDTFYCVDSDYGRATIRRTLASSLLGDRLGSQANILKAATKYWYISSYSITPNLTFEDIGTKYYANIVVTGSVSLAVSANSSDNVLLNAYNYDDYQKWYFERQSDKSYKITNFKTGKCLDLSNSNPEDGTNIGVYKSNNGDNQRWYIIKNGTGYSLVPKCATGSCMDVQGAKFVAGTNIQLYHNKQNDAQRFKIVKLHTLAYNANGGTGSIADAPKGSGYGFTIRSNPFSRNGYTFAGYFVNRKSDNTWYVQSIGWVSAGTFRNKDYRLKLYQPGEQYDLTTEWTNGGVDNDTFTFYAQWMPNESVIRFAENYSGNNYLLGSDLAEDYTQYIHTRKNAYTVSIDTSERVNNQNTLKIVGTAAGSSGNDLELLTSTNEGYSTGYCMMGMAGDDKDMVVSFYAKSSVDGAKLFTRWGYNTTNSYKSITLSKTWKRYTIVLPKNRHFDNCIYLHFDKAGTFYLNSIAVSDGTNENESLPETGRWACDPIRIPRGSTIPTMPLPERDGYTFLGWYTAAESGEQITESTPIEAMEITLYAHWKKVVPIAIEDPILGDADGDGVVTSVDVTYIQRACAMMTTGIDEAVLMFGDVDGNGELEIVDATYIQRHLAQMTTPYQIG